VEHSHAFYDFEAKYLAGDVALVCPADVPDEVAAEMTDLAVRAFEAAGCEGLARVDFFYADDGRVILNEINTMPGFTPLSMFPRMWAATGLDYPALVERLILLALTRDTGLR
jgi:D-alanine-D-alanine ligase